MKNWPWMIIYIDRNKFLETDITRIEREYGIEIVGTSNSSFKRETQGEK